MSSEPQRGDPSPRATPIRDRVIIPEHCGVSLRGICSVSSPPLAGPVVASFRRNLEAIIWVMTMPYATARAGAFEARYRQVLASERINARFLKEGFADEGAQMQEACRCAAEALESDEEVAHIEADTIRCLQALFADGQDLAVGAQELLRQTLVLAWSAFEVLTGELFRLILNLHPALVQKLADDDRTRRMFQLKSIPLDVVFSNDFDLSGRMGDILAAVHPVDSAVSANIVFGVLLPCPPASLDSSTLRLLNQRRHLILHSRCIVDSAYVKATGCTQQVGSELAVTTSDVAGGIQTVHDCGVELISAVGQQL